MKTVTFKSVLNGVATRMGLNPGFLLPEGEAAALTEYINSWAEEALDAYPWPELVSLRGPLALVDGEMDVESDLAGDEVTEVFKAAPGAYLRNALSVPYRLRGDKIAVSGGLSEVWVESRRAFVRFTHVPFDSGASYAAGDVAYFPDDGEVKMYTGSSWTVVPFWEFVAEYVKSRAAAEAKREAGLIEAAEVQDAKAQQMLDRKMDKLEMIQGQGRRYGVITPERAKGV